MATKIEDETWVTENPDGSICLDAYAGMSREELKDRCRDLCSALDEWHHIAMVVADHGMEGLWPEAKDKLTRMIEAYKD